MFKQNEYREEDFSQGCSIYKGKLRDIPLDKWTFDSYLQCFVREELDQIVSIRYKDDKWFLTLLVGPNQLLSENYDDLADAFAKGNELF